MNIHFCNADTIRLGSLLPGEGSLICRKGCPFKSTILANMSYVCTSFSEQENWTFGEQHAVVNFSFVAGHTVMMSYFFAPSSSHIWTAFSLTARTDTGRINSTPRAVFAPVTRLLEGCNHTITLAVSDPDGDDVRCVWADFNKGECSEHCQHYSFPGATIDQNTCTIEYQANKGIGYKVATVVLQDFSPESLYALSRVSLEFLVLVIADVNQSCAQAPEFVEPTIHAGSCAAIPPGATFTTQLVANSNDVNVSIVEIQSIPPLGTIVGQLTQIPDSNSYYVNITWTPAASQQNQTHPFCFTAVGSGTQTSKQICISLLAGYFPPAPLHNTALPNRQLVRPSNTNWSISFDTSIERSSIMGKIAFHEFISEEEVYTIDASQSLEVTFVHPNNLSITPNFLFAEKTRYYITFDRNVVQGLEHCRPGNEPLLNKTFWCFDTLDVTPPIITFLVSPDNSNNSNISFSWESNENVTWTCVLEQGSMEYPVNCSDAYWSGYGLSEGPYILQVTATDEAGNVATLTHAFLIDLTPPTAVIQHRPNSISNERTTTLTFTCNEHSCSYDCCLISNMEEGNISSCNSGSFTTPMLQENTIYTFQVRATDQAGNKGETVSYTWETDFEAPHITGVQNNTRLVLCNDALPESTGEAQATDNKSDNVTLIYSDVRIECSIKRTWKATDAAGNSALLVQYINLEPIPTISLLSHVSLPCDSTASSLQVPINTASFPNLCDLPFQLKQDDSELRACPGTFTRNWTISSCGRSATALQTVILYNLCPQYACGRNESVPRGTCSLGECQCNLPWHGDNCDTVIYKPVADPVSNSTLLETQDYMVTVTVSQGSPPLVWTLVSGPEQLLLEYTGQIIWRSAQAGSYLVSVQIENQIGRAQAEWTLQVIPGYTARLSSVSSTVFPHAQPVVIDGYVEYTENNLIERNQVGIVLVFVDIVTNGSSRTIETYTTSSGNFSLTFSPISTEYGTYTAGARHPASPQLSQAQVQWGVLGMRSVPEGVIALNGEVISTFERTFFNATFILNDGPGPLTGITATPILTSSEYVSAEIFLRGFSSNRTVMPGEQIALDIRVTASRTLRGSFQIIVEATEGTRLQLIVSLRVEAVLPSLSIIPPSLNARIVRGRGRIFEFNVTNVGKGTAHDVGAIIPDTSYISLISFGNTQQNTGGILRLESGESSILSILAQVPETQQLGDITATVAISSNEVASPLPIALIVSSNSLMNLTLIVEDEYTYFAISGRPYVNDAIVTLINSQRNLRLVSAGNGSVEFIDIYEDRYEMIVEAPSHTRLTQIIVTSSKYPIVTVFIKRQGVTYTLSVTPVTYQDIYVVSIEADFQTNVPIPEVTVDPITINLDDIEAGFITSFQINVTNHGFIRADNVNIELPTHPSLKFSTSTEFLGHLEPRSSVIVSVNSSRKSLQKRDTECVGAYWINFLYSYVCDEARFRRVPVVLKETLICIPGNPPDFIPGHRESASIVYSDFGGLISGGGEAFYHEVSGDFNIDGSTRGGVRDSVIFSFSGFTTETLFFCDPCVTKIVRCVIPSSIPDLLQSIAKVPLVGCIPLLLSHTNPTSSIPNALSWLQCTVGTETTGLLLCAVNQNLFTDCLRSGTSGHSKRNVRRTLNDFVEALYPIQQSVALGIEVLGDEVWISVEDPQWLSSVLQPTLADGSEEGVLISPTELSVILAASPPNGTTIDMVATMVERINNTLFGWTSGQLEPPEGSNMASFSRVQELSQILDTYNSMAVDNGFLSYIDKYNFAGREVNQIDNFEDEVGVCAVVRIRIEQELAVTREAFLAKLEIENMDDSPLQNILIEIVFTDSVTGVLSTHLFSIGNGTYTGSLEDGSGSLASGATGAVEWLIIPYSEAAPDADHDYNVGGYFSYLFDGENITVPFLPTPIIVRPDASLLVYYFWERHVVGDDPFTDDVELSIPFTLGVVVKNVGYGAAYDLKISSGQPEIIENEKGLLVNFMIIGANVGGKSASPSLTVTFGDLEPNTTAVARWFMISSLQGEFISYNATFENINPLGDPKLSILDDLQTHELIRNVEMYTSSEDDGILDFLVNDRSDYLAYPDTLYSSSSLKRYNVSTGTVISVQATLESSSVTLVVKASTNITGWVYYRYEDVQNMLYNTAFSINNSKDESNVTVTLPSQNSWITSDRDGTFYLHIVDYLETTDEVVYTLHNCIENCPSIGVPFIQPTVKCKGPYDN